MGLSLRSIGRKIQDVFDANTQADQQRRLAAGQPRFYQQQQHPSLGQRIGSVALNPIGSLVNRGFNAPLPTPGTDISINDFTAAVPGAALRVGKGVADTFLGNTQRLIQTADVLPKSYFINRDYQAGKITRQQALNQLMSEYDQGFVKGRIDPQGRFTTDITPEVGADPLAETAKFAGRFATAGAKIAPEVAPLARGASTAYKGMTLAKAAPNILKEGGVYSGLKLGTRLVEQKGQVTPGQVAADVVSGPALELAGFGASRAIKVGAKKAVKLSDQLGEEGFLGLSGRDPRIQALNSKAKELNRARDQLLAQGKPQSSAAVRANDRAYSAVIQRRDKIARQIDQGGYIQLPGGNKPRVNLKNPKVAQSPDLGTDLGITSFRGQPVKKVADTLPYYNTPRSKGFEAALQNEAANHGIQLNKLDRSAGVWQGSLEPSFHANVTGSKAAKLAYAANLGQKANQDAVLVFTPRANATGAKYVFNGVGDPDKVIARLSKHGIDGATIKGKDLIVYDLDNSLKPGIVSLTKSLGITPKTTLGEVDFLEKGDYGKHIAGATGGIRDRLSAQLESSKNILKDETGAIRPFAGLAPDEPTPPKLNLPEAKPKVALKTRGFAKNLSKDSDPQAQAIAELIPGYKKITNKGTLTKAATEINKDATAAYARFITKPQITSADDVATGNILLRKYLEDGDMESAIDVGMKLGLDATPLAQAVQAYSTFRKTSPEGILREATKLSAKAGRELDPAAARQLVEQARAIAAMPEGFEKAKATQEMLGQATALGRTWHNTLQEVLSTPRAAMATGDFSASLRQAAVLGSRFPKQFATAFKSQFKYFANSEAYQKEMYGITQRPTFGLMKSTPLAVRAAEEATGTEELFMPSILERKIARKLGIGKLVQASNRAYSGLLTRLRADVFDKIYADTQSAGIKLSRTQVDDIAKFINSASGRGSLGGLERSSGLLSQALFSPRLWKSRLDLINPRYYQNLDPVARKYALQSAASFMSLAATVVGLAKLSGADVETDMRSADFAKIKVGNTRYDILGGHQQNIRLIAQLVTGEKVNSETGELQTLGPDRGFGKPSRVDLLYQFIENKENPAVAFATKALRGTDPTGEPINLATEAGKLGLPLALANIYGTGKDTGSIGKGAAMNVPGIFGVGVQTYGTVPTKDKGKALTPEQAERLSTGEEAVLKQGKTPKTGKKLGDNLFQLSNGKFLTKVGNSFKSFDDREKAELAVVTDEFKRSGDKSRVFGGTYLYKNKQGDVKSKPKVLYDWEQEDAKLNLSLDRAYEASNLDQWLDLAQKKYDGLERKKGMFDPDTEQDEIDKITLQQENLMQKAEKYAEKGINKSGGRGGSRVALREPTLSASSAKRRIAVIGGPGRAPTVKMARASKGAAPKVSLKKSLV